ncbi:hypothetical protein [Massilia sp.]|uniref:hypothetical protein n=1 Tax=Massilia sp. TaxID=1882437 RepID=UPI0028A20A27|nr:hypothetical protein [Massilia sp.]
MLINERQRRRDGPAANAVARGLNILAARNADLASRYMRHKLVPEHVIARVLGHPALRRKESAGQSVSEAITPSSRDDQSSAAAAADQTQAESQR